MIDRQRRPLQQNLNSFVPLTQFFWQGPRVRNLFVLRSKYARTLTHHWPAGPVIQSFAGQHPRRRSPWGIKLLLATCQHPLAPQAPRFPRSLVNIDEGLFFLRLFELIYLAGSHCAACLSTWRSSRLAIKAINTSSHLGPTLLVSPAFWLGFVFMAILFSWVFWAGWFGLMEIWVLCFRKKAISYSVRWRDDLSLGFDCF